MRIPSATYRIQFNHTFGFEAARSILEYLERLGVTDIYASPIFCANPESMHGYDVTDPTRLNPELGSPAEFESLMDAVRGKGMGWLQDFVPNHMAYSHHNHWLMDVLEYGPASPYARFFDILWDHPDPALNGKVLAPFLGEPLAQTIDGGRLKLEYDAAGFSAVYYDHRFPVNLYAVAEIVRDDTEKTLIPYLPAIGERPDRAVDQDRKARLQDMYEQNPGVRAAIRSLLVKVQNDMNAFKTLMDGQFYHLAYWKTVAEKINYRRFFYINDLIGLTIEHPEAFETVHRTVADGVRRGLLTGLRIDHLDGLRYPGRYLQQLRDAFGDLYVVAEKILEKDETLPARWPLQGTTGYGFGNYATAVFCDHRHRDVFVKQYAEFIGRTPDYERLLYRQKKKVITAHMQGDVDNLVRLLQQTPRIADSADEPAALSDGLISLIAAFGVYRTYIEEAAVSPNDRDYITAAVEQAGQMQPECIPVLQSLQTMFLAPDKSPQDLDFITRFQQITGPAMAKGFEDTLLYVYNPLISLNEVGSMPEVFGITVEQFHAFNRARLQTPHTLNSASTHDTKRGEDVRARINILSEIPDEWFEKAAAWQSLNQPCKTQVDGAPAPDANDEYLIYQTMLGALPVDAADYGSFCERLQAYIVKTIREAKRHGTWIEPNQAYEQAAVRFIENLFERPEDDDFWRDFIAFWQRIHEYGLLGSWAQCLLKMTSPGVPDFYQGTECRDLNLVDPDNRRPVDYLAHSRLLEQCVHPEDRDRPARPEDLLARRDTGLVKLFIIQQTLQMRKRLPELFAEGDYVPVQVKGAKREHLIAYIRIHKDRFVLVTVPRRFTGLTLPGQMPLGEAAWADTTLQLPPAARGSGTDIFTQQQISLHNELPVATILTAFPVSVIDCAG